MAAENSEEIFFGQQIVAEICWNVENWIWIILVFHGWWCRLVMSGGHKHIACLERPGRVSVLNIDRNGWRVQGSHLGNALELRRSLLSAIWYTWQPCLTVQFDCFMLLSCWMLWFMASWEGPKIGIHAHDVPAQILRLWSWNVTHMAKQPDKLWTLQPDPGETRCSQINFTDMLFPVTQTSATCQNHHAAMEAQPALRTSPGKTTWPNPQKQSLTEDPSSLYAQKTKQLTEINRI